MKNYPVCKVILFFRSESDEEDQINISEDSEDELFNPPSSSRKSQPTGRQTATRSRSSKPSPSSRSSKPSGKRGILYSDDSDDEDIIPAARKRKR